MVPGSDDLNTFLEGATSKASKRMLCGCNLILYVDYGGTWSSDRSHFPAVGGGGLLGLFGLSRWFGAQNEQDKPDKLDNFLHPLPHASIDQAGLRR